MAEVITYKQLAQRQLSASDTVIYQVPSSGIVTTIENIIVCNTSASSATTYSLYVNQGAATSGDGFALVKSASISTNTFSQPLGVQPIHLESENARLIGTSGSRIVTVTVYGYEREET